MMMTLNELDDNDVVIASAARTAMGGFQGVFSSVSATELGAAAISAAVTRAGIDVSSIDEVLMGNVLSAGVGQAPARQAALGAGVGDQTPCTTVSKVCGSGMKAVMLAYDQVKAGSADVVVAGGMESMSKAPYFLPKAREGMRLGHGEIKDHMFFDGLEDAYTGKAMGSFAQGTADDKNISREAMDAFAVESLKRANQAIEAGYFDEEIEPVTVKSRAGETTVSNDEQPAKAKPEKIPTLRPAFSKDGSITAANASSISDGAAVMLVMSASKAKALGVTPLARIIGHANYASVPGEFTTAPIASIQKLINKIDWSLNSVDLFEINEAFAMVTMMAVTELGLDSTKVNVNGGACALGHPIGASGARIMVTLLYALKRLGKTRGLASLCIGGGEATSIAVELL